MKATAETRLPGTPGGMTSVPQLKAPPDALLPCRPARPFGPGQRGWPSEPVRCWSFAPLVAGSPATAATPARAAAGPVNLGSAAGYSVLAGPSIANTGSGTVLALDLGVTGTLAGFPPGAVTGTTHVKAPRCRDRPGGPARRRTTPWSPRPVAPPSPVTRPARRYTPGLYTTAAAITNTGTITLDAAGDPSARLRLPDRRGPQLRGRDQGRARERRPRQQRLLAGGRRGRARCRRRSASGRILGAGVVAFGDGASLKGRVLTPSTVALANSPITKPIDDLTAPVVAIDGGPARSTNDTTPSISGTTDEPARPWCTRDHRLADLDRTASPGVSGPSSADTLTAGPHTVVASVTDPSGNTGTATQVLTVDPHGAGRDDRRRSRRAPRQRHARRPSRAPRTSRRRR